MIMAFLLCNHQLEEQLRPNQMFPKFQILFYFVKALASAQFPRDNNACIQALQCHADTIEWKMQRRPLGLVMLHSSPLQEGEGVCVLNRTKKSVKPEQLANLVNRLFLRGDYQTIKLKHLYSRDLKCRVVTEKKKLT